MACRDSQILATRDQYLTPNRIPLSQAIEI